MTVPMPPRVFVLNPAPDRVYRDAERFGHVLAADVPQVFPDDQFRVEDINSRVRLLLSGFEIRSDYLLAQGDPVVIAMAVGHIVARPNLERWRLRMLKWDRENSRYYPVMLSFHD